MPTSRLFQICYSAATRDALEPGFLALDNLANPRPDWREYWPIRAWLKANAPDESEFIGFFSPRFRSKTGLTSDAVNTFIASQPVGADVVLFSPFFDQIALYWNVFEQGMNHHPGSFDTFQQAAALAVPGVDLRSLTTDSRNTVFSNYFVARPRFWRAWLEANERVFTVAESAQGDLAQHLNHDTDYRDGGAPLKVFVMERMATLLLATDPQWRVAVHDPMKTPLDATMQPFAFQLLCLDALKIASTAGHSPHYREAYRAIRKQVSRDSKAQYAANAAPLRNRPAR